MTKDIANITAFYERSAPIAKKILEDGIASGISPDSILTAFSAALFAGAKALSDSNAEMAELIDAQIEFLREVTTTLYPPRND